MLGIRRHGSTAVDLWVGPRGVFSADKVIETSQVASLKADPDLHWAIWVDPLRLEVLMDQLRDKIDAFTPRRCTLMLEDVENYDLLEKQFFISFPE